MPLVSGASLQKRRAVGPYSRPRAIATIDGRTREGRFIRDVRSDLLSHVGGRPSVTQAALIERAVMLSLHVAMMDAKAASGRVLSEHDSRTYLAWSNALARTLRQLGLKGAAAEPRSLRDSYTQAAAG
jgi:hypothetical protein